MKTPLWKVILPVFVILGLVVGGLTFVKLRVAGNGGAPSAADLRVGSTLPDFLLTRYGGGSLQVSELKPKVAMINFWASWCEACMVEMPSIIKLRNAFKDKGFEVIAINVDDNPDAVLPKTLKELDMRFPVYVDPDSKLAELFDVHAIPLTVLIDQNRKILLIEDGGRDWNSPDFRQQMEGWIAG